MNYCRITMTGLKTKLFPALILFSVFFVPDIRVAPNLPLFRLEDILLPIALFFLFSLNKELIYRQKYFLLIGATAIWVAITIIANLSHNALRDWFEIYKLFKYGIYFLYFYYFIRLEFIISALRILFFPLLIFNLLHYFNIAGFNETVMPVFGETVHLENFGLNSLGQPGTKRMIGTGGNPNDNSLLFLFFLAFFLPQKKFKGSELTFFLFCFAAIILCQSRTGFISAILLVIINLIAIRPQITYALLQIAGPGVIFLLINKIELSTNEVPSPENPSQTGTSYLNSITSPEIVETGSFQGRVEIWKHMWEMSKERLLLGHGPYKNYFYSNNLYPEGQYPLWLWRYGIPGFLLHLSIFLYPILFGLSKKLKKFWNPGVMFLIAMFVAGLTNTPFHNTQVIILLALSAAVAFIQPKKESE